MATDCNSSGRSLANKIGDANFLLLELSLFKNEVGSSIMNMASDVNLLNESAGRIPAMVTLD